MKAFVNLIFVLLPLMSIDAGVITNTVKDENRRSLLDHQMPDDVVFDLAGRKTLITRDEETDEYNTFKRAVSIAENERKQSPNQRPEAEGQTSKAILPTANGEFSNCERDGFGCKCRKQQRCPLYRFVYSQAKLNVNCKVYEDEGVPFVVDPWSGRKYVVKYSVTSGDVQIFPVTVTRGRRPLVRDWSTGTANSVALNKYGEVELVPIARNEASRSLL